jgi:hypothetical protein
MRTTWINLGEKDEPVPGNENLPDYMDVRKALNELKGRAQPFTTRVASLEELGGANWEYQFMTSSKDLHLGFGRMDSVLQWRFASMLHEAMERGQGADQLVLKYDERYVFVTRATLLKTSTNVIAFHFESGR